MLWWRIAGIVGALGVACGAFGAHALESRIEDARLLEVWETAARYQMFHALALVGVAVHPGHVDWAGRLFTVGVLLFCGSLYAMTLTGYRWLGAITPLGGLCFIAGWVVLALAAVPSVDG
jgi:uncharacterized membrane protein YgdD (TMEM256/DUF423 family)